MIELCFGESLAGSLQYAIAMKKDDTRFDAAAVGVIGGTRKERAQALRDFFVSVHRTLQTCITSIV